MTCKGGEHVWAYLPSQVEWWGEEEGQVVMWEQVLAWPLHDKADKTDRLYNMWMNAHLVCERPEHGRVLWLRGWWHHALTCALFHADTRALQVGRLDEYGSAVQGLGRQALEAVVTLTRGDGNLLLALGMGWETKTMDNIKNWSYSDGNNTSQVVGFLTHWPLSRAERPKQWTLLKTAHVSMRQTECFLT